MISDNCPSLSDSCPSLGEGLLDTFKGVPSDTSSDESEIGSSIPSNPLPEEDDYDPANESFDYSSSSRAFSTPYFSITDSPEPLNYKLSYLSVENPNFKAEIGRVVLGHLLRDGISKQVRFVDAQRVTNQAMHEACLKFQSQLDKRGDPKEFTYLFMDIGGYDPVFEHHLFSEGLSCGNLPISFLGDPGTGVYLSKCADTCSVSPLIPFLPQRLIIFKVLLGRTQVIYGNNYLNPGSLDLEPSYNSRCLRPTNGPRSNHDAFHFNMVYAYDVEVDEKGITAMEYPRSIYPYAAVTFYISGLYSGIPSIRLPFLPKNKIAAYDFHFGSYLRMTVEAYSMHDNGRKIDELCIDGINIKKCVPLSSFGSSAILRQFFSGLGGNFLNTDSLKIQLSTVDYFLGHTCLMSSSRGFRNLVKGLKHRNQGLVFGVPWMPRYTKGEEQQEQQMGFCLPSCTLTSMLGIPIFAADVLHCFVLFKVPLNLVYHPLKTVRREGMLMNMASEGRIGRSDKISDNDIRSALQMIQFPQVGNLEAEDYIMDEEGDVEMVEDVGNGSYQYYDYSAIMDQFPMEADKPTSPEKKAMVDYSTISISPEELSKEIEAADDEYEKMTTSFSQPYQKKPTKEFEPSSQTSPAPHVRAIYENPTMKTLVILEPVAVKDGLIDPEILGTLMELIQTRAESSINSNMQIIYHDSMRGEKLNSANNKCSPEKAGAYKEIEDRFSCSEGISYTDLHICDNSRLTIRALLVCLLTLKRKREFDNAVLISCTPQKEVDITTFRTHKIFLTDPQTFIDMLQKGDNSFLY
ncbi:hypothetical protein FO519_003006 [Halicephalobus sp. NKZ332]|nr:hypothetical protein FO519_003006 [Halicephalobus sp. NKZ332]